MSGFETDKYSSVRAILEVELTPPLEKFLARTAAASVVFLGYRDSTLLPEPASVEELLAENYQSKVQGVGIPTATMYQATKLRATLYERRRVSTPRTYKSLARLASRVLALPLEEVEPTISDDDLVVPSYEFVETTRSTRSREAREFGLKLADGPAVRNFQAVSDFIYSTADRPAGSKRAERDDRVLPTVVPLLSVPARTPDKAIDDMTNYINNQGVLEPLAVLHFAHYAWEVKRR